MRLRPCALSAATGTNLLSDLGHGEFLLHGLQLDRLTLSKRCARTGWLREIGQSPADVLIFRKLMARQQMASWEAGDQLGRLAVTANQERHVRTDQPLRLAEPCRRTSRRAPLQSAVGICAATACRTSGGCSSPTFFATLAGRAMAVVLGYRVYESDARSALAGHARSGRGDSIAGPGALRRTHRRSQRSPHDFEVGLLTLIVAAAMLRVACRHSNRHTCNLRRCTSRCFVPALLGVRRAGGQRVRSAASCPGNRWCVLPP